MLSWYALHIRHNCEQLVSTALAGRCETFWPHRETKASVGRQRGQHRIVRRAWFPGYMFVRCDWDRPDHRAMVLGDSHVLGVMGAGAIAIPDGEIESLQTLMSAKADVILHHVVKLGDKVRVVRGPLAGVEGVLSRFAGQSMLVVQVELLGRAVATHIPEYAVETLARAPRMAA